MLIYFRGKNPNQAAKSPVLFPYFDMTAQEAARCNVIPLFFTALRKSSSTLMNKLLVYKLASIATTARLLLFISVFSTQMEVDNGENATDACSPRPEQKFTCSAHR